MHYRDGDPVGKRNWESVRDQLANCVPSPCLRRFFEMMMYIDFYSIQLSPPINPTIYIIQYAYTYNCKCILYVWILAMIFSQDKSVERSEPGPKGARLLL